MSACAEAVPLMSSGSMMLRQRSTMMPPAPRPNLYIDEVRPHWLAVRSSSAYVDMHLLCMTGTPLWWSRPWIG